MPPASGVAPLWTPCLRGLRFNYGEQMSTLGDTPRPLRKGGALWTPAATPRHCEEWSDAAIWGGGVTP